jgi:hypothetical protein
MEMLTSRPVGAFRETLAGLGWPWPNSTCRISSGSAPASRQKRAAARARGSLSPPSWKPRARPTTSASSAGPSSWPARISRNSATAAAVSASSLAVRAHPPARSPSLRFAPPVSGCRAANVQFIYRRRGRTGNREWGAVRPGAHRPLTRPVQTPAGHPPEGHVFTDMARPRAMRPSPAASARSPTQCSRGHHLLAHRRHRRLTGARPAPACSPGRCRARPGNSPGLRQ